MYLRPSDISRRLYCTSRPSWWSRRCPRRTNERPLKRDEERGEKRDWLPLLKFREQHGSRRCALFGWEIVSFVSRTTLSRALVRVPCLRYPDCDILGKATRFHSLLLFRSFVDNSFSRRTIERSYRCYHPSAAFEFSSRILCDYRLQVSLRNGICKNRILIYCSVIKYKN